MLSKKHLTNKLMYAPQAFLVLVCIFLSIYFFHDYMIRSLWLFLPITGLVAGAVFGLLYLIRRIIRKVIEKKNNKQE